MRVIKIEWIWTTSMRIRLTWMSKMQQSLTSLKAACEDQPLEVIKIIMKACSTSGRDSESAKMSKSLTLLADKI